MTASAFSLIELTVAMALGLLVALVAYAGFQVGAKSFSAARQLSAENHALVNGYRAAADEADFWFSADDWGNPTGQQQRRGYTSAGAVGTIGVNGVFGQPFAPCALPGSYWNWNFSDPQLWPTQGAHRRVFETDVETLPNGGSHNPVQLGHIAHPNLTARKLHVIRDRLYMSLGWSGYLHYLPSHLPVDYHLGPGGINSFGNAVSAYAGENHGGRHNAYNPGLPQMLVNATGWPRWGYHLPTPYGRYGLYTMKQIAFLAPRDGWNVNQTQPAGYIAASMRGTYLASPQPEVGSQVARLPWAEVAAASQEVLSVRVDRSLAHMAPARTRLIVGVTNPDSGRRIGVVYEIPATTLRGARGQRQWTHRGGATLDTATP